MELREIVDLLGEYTDSFGGVALVPSPPAGSCDNLGLFSSTAAVLLSHLVRVEPRNDLTGRFVLSCQVEPGSFMRRPLILPGNEPTDFDDHLGIACWSALCGAPRFAQDIFAFGAENDWEWPAGFLGRFPIFEPVVRAAADKRLSLSNEAKAAAAFLGNIFEDRWETSGRCMLYLASRVFALRDPNGLRYPILAVAIWLWRWRIKKLYGGMVEIYSIYFGPGHPITELARAGCAPLKP